MQNIRINPKNLNYHVDIVICIDTSHSMTPIINQVKENAKKIPATIIEECINKGKKIKTLRLKLIKYCNMYLEQDPNRMVVGDFSTDAEDFLKELDGLVTQDGNADYNAFENKYGLFSDEFQKLGNESTLDAVLHACESEWISKEGKKRKIIIAMTDEPAGVIHPDSLLDGESRGVDTVINRYMSISESNEARLLLIGPECEDFEALAKAEFTQYIKCSPGQGLEEIGFYDTVIPWVVNSI